LEITDLTSMWVSTDLTDDPGADHLKDLDLQRVQRIRGQSNWNSGIKVLQTLIVGFFLGWCTCLFFGPGCDRGILGSWGDWFWAYKISRWDFKVTFGWFDMLVTGGFQLLSAWATGGFTGPLSAAVLALVGTSVIRTQPQIPATWHAPMFQMHSQPSQQQTNFNAQPANPGPQLGPHLAWNPGLPTWHNQVHNSQANWAFPQAKGSAWLKGKGQQKKGGVLPLMDYNSVFRQPGFVGPVVPGFVGPPDLQILYQSPKGKGKGKGVGHV